MPKAFRWLGFVLLAGCGGTTKATPTEHQATGGGSHSAGSTSGGTAAAGSASAGADVGGSGANGGANAGAGAGGKIPDFPGGSPNSPFACSAPYAGPTGGPRGDGPIEELNSCATIPDAIVLARYKNYEARVPRGLYYEPTENITSWHEPCSNSEAETVARGPTDGMGTFVESYSSEWFHEAVYCFSEAGENPAPSVRRIERNLRCDYFDGTKLAQPTPERLAFLASLLWWGDHANHNGVAILGHAVAIGNATDVVELCTLSVTTGDVGLCDEVRVENTRHLLQADGTVKLGTPEVIRTLKGDCH